MNEQFLTEYTANEFNSYANAQLLPVDVTAANLKAVTFC